MELAEAAGSPTEWRSVSLEDLLAADEVLLTGSSKSIVPVVDIDGQSIGTGRPGAICAELRAAYAARIASESLRYELEV